MGFMDQIKKDTGIDLEKINKNNKISDKKDTNEAAHKKEVNPDKEILEKIKKPSTKPLVTSSDPVNNATNIARNKVITVTFSEPLKWGTFWIELKNSSGTVISTTRSITSNVLTITPLALLTPNTKYTICLHSGCVTDYSGNPLVGVVKSFTTETI